MFENRNVKKCPLTAYTCAAWASNAADACWCWSGGWGFAYSCHHLLTSLYYCHLSPLLRPRPQKRQGRRTAGPSEAGRPWKWIKEYLSMAFCLVLLSPISLSCLHVICSHTRDSKRSKIVGLLRLFTTSLASKYEYARTYIVVKRKMMPAHVFFDE